MYLYSSCLIKPTWKALHSMKLQTYYFDRPVRSQTYNQCLAQQVVLKHFGTHLLQERCPGAPRPAFTFPPSMTSSHTAQPPCALLPAFQLCQGLAAQPLRSQSCHHPCISSSSHLQCFCLRLVPLAAHKPSCLA